MPYFVIIPIWLVLLIVAAGLAFIPSLRRVAAYIAVCSTSGLIVSVLLSTLLLVLTAKLPWSKGGSTVGGLVLIGSYIGGLVFGGLGGMLLGYWCLYRALHRRKPTMSYAQVADTLEAFVRGTGRQWDWDNYISATFFDDPYLQEVQRRMVNLSDEYPAGKRQGYCSPEGLAVIQRYVVDLRRRSQQTY